MKVIYKTIKSTLWEAYFKAKKENRKILRFELSEEELSELAEELLLSDGRVPASLKDFPDSFLQIEIRKVPHA